MIKLYRPCNSLTHVILPRYENELTQLKKNGLWRAPFQFTIPIMAAMWLDLQRAWIQARAPSWKLDGGRSIKVLDMETLWKNGKNAPWARLDPELRLKKPNKLDHALRCPIRAVAYFSWDESGRVFLVRRVFPSYFNFLSYSHCPEGWGALGAMVKELKEGRGREEREQKPGYFNESFMPITRIEGFSQSALPFLSEVTRLKYKAIFVMPIVRMWGRFESTNDLLGAFVFFVRNRQNLPAQWRDGELAPWLATTNNLFVDVLNRQEILFRRPPLERKWREIARRLRRDNSIPPAHGSLKDGEMKKTDIGVFEIRITQGSGRTKRIDFRSVVSNLIASLSTNEFHTIFDSAESEKLKSGVVVLVAKSELITIDKVKAAVMRAVGAACEEQPEKFVVKLRKL